MTNLIEPELRKRLVTTMERVAKETGDAVATVSRKSSGDAKFYEKVSDGGNFTVRRFDEVMAALEARLSHHLAVAKSISGKAA